MIASHGRALDPDPDARAVLREGTGRMHAIPSRPIRHPQDPSPRILGSNTEIQDEEELRCLPPPAHPSTTDRNEARNVVDVTYVGGGTFEASGSSMTGNHFLASAEGRRSFNHRFANCSSQSAWKFQGSFVPPASSWVYSRVWRHTQPSKEAVPWCRSARFDSHHLSQYRPSADVPTARSKGIIE